MAKDAKGHGSERSAIGIVNHRGMTEHVHIGPTKAGIAANKGWADAVSMKKPGELPKVYETIAKAKSSLEKHPGFSGWHPGTKAPAKPRNT